MMDHWRKALLWSVNVISFVLQRYHTPTRSKSRSASVEERGDSETPPHWKEEMKKTKAYQPPSLERWTRGDRWLFWGFFWKYDLLRMSCLIRSFLLHTSFDLPDCMNTLQADGITEVTLRGPTPQNIHPTAAQRGLARGDSWRKRRRKPNTRRRPKNVNTARRSAPRSKLAVITDQREKSLCLQRESPEDPVLHPVSPQIDMSHQSGGGAILLCLSETPGPIPDRTRPVVPDLEGG